MIYSFIIILFIPLYYQHIINNLYISIIFKFKYDHMNNSALFSNLRKLISIVDNLRDIGLQQYMKLPKIVVVGTQSAGKSSLLQQIVGIDFLPRGSGVVTRRPLQMRLVYVPKQNLVTPYATFDEIPGKKFQNFNDVKKLIQQLTDRICGSDKNIVDKPIILYVYSSSCPNLTLVDLPGLTKVPIKGQPENIYEITEKMTRKYIEDQSTIILCVIAANQDLSTSQALSLVNKIDLNGQRTLGCLTKIDIMDRGTNARKILLNQQIQLKLGYIGIKNRSQHDIIENKSVAQSLLDQKKYFATNPAYSTLPPLTTGTQSLTTKLTELLYTQIKKFMPTLIDELTRRIGQLQKQVKIYGPALPKTDIEKIDIVWKMTNLYLSIIKSCLEGVYNPNIKLSKQQLQTGPSIRLALHSLYKKKYQRSATRKITDKKIQIAIQSFEGQSIPGFPSIDSFLFLMIPLIDKLKKPAFKCVNLIYTKLEELAMKSIQISMPRYSNFRDQFKDVILNTFQVCKKDVINSITDIIQSQKGYIHTNDHFYMTEIQTSTNVSTKQKLSEQAKKNPLILVLRKRIDCYYKIIVRNIRDIVSKQIYMFMVKIAQTKMQFDVFEMISNTGRLEKWLTQREDLKKQRQLIEKQYQTLKKAEKCIKSDKSLYDLYSMSKMKQLKKLEQQKKAIRQAEKKKQMDQLNKKRQDEQQKKLKQDKEQHQKKKNNNELLNESTNKNKHNQSFNVSNQNKHHQNLNNTNMNKTNNNIIVKQKDPDIFKNVFGIQIKKQKNPTENYNQNMGKTTDKAVDELYKNDKFKQQSKNAVQKGTTMAIQQKLGPGNEGKAALIGKGTAALFGTDIAQNYMKQQTKEIVRDQTQIKKE